MDPQLKPLFEAASGLFAGAGRYAWHFARGKLRRDPVFFALLKHGVFPDRGRLLDLGCGHGILFALLIVAKEQFQRGQWPQGWPPPPLNLDMHGIDMHKERVRVARLALGDRVQVDQGDIREIRTEPCSVITLLDVLFYLDEAGQDRVLENAARALGPGGLLLLREADADAGLAFRMTKWGERIVELGRGHFRPRLCYRSAVRWVASLQALGFTVSVEPMSAGTPFANMLFRARCR
jgi:SAM-dependent methyltransferase